MYYEDHNPPHFHAQYAGMHAEYDIRTLDVLAGKIPERAHALVLGWASFHKKDLMNNWEKARVLIMMDKIEPLS